MICDAFTSLVIAQAGSCSYHIAPPFPMPETNLVGRSKMSFIGCDTTQKIWSLGERERKEHESRPAVVAVLAKQEHFEN